ncbi:MAG: saccharopine dehydrogenase NADP-binding domain-containing protein [Sandaracinaceae bacterium]|nr:saccharopine dehydrogenase NADP-binding domain-containing protein [Sandaracinaceae bacterium]
MSEREFEIVLFGATGFTGALVAEHLVANHLKEGLRLAFGGRSREKLEALRARLARFHLQAAEIPIFVADAFDRKKLEELAKRTKVVATAVGPYGKYGEQLVAACASQGTHYADLTGEIPFMRRMIERYEGLAQSTGACIVHACGYDAVPSDLGAWLVVRRYIEQFDQVPRRVLNVVRKAKGGVSGGTFASMLFVLGEASQSQKVRQWLNDPFALIPGEREQTQVSFSIWPRHEPLIGAWVVPSVMARVNVPIVYRSAWILRRENKIPPSFWPYDEVMEMKGGALEGALRASLFTAGFVGAQAVLSFGLGRSLFASFAPSPGEGPPQSLQEKGYFESHFIAEGEKGLVQLRFRGEGDPGYGATSRMLGESAMCLARDLLESRSGFYTPASAMGDALVQRLRQHRFEIEFET